jgi:hypothetical protein
VIGDRVFIEWGDKLSGFEDKQLKNGLGNCLKAKHNFAPNLKEFISHCMDEVAGLTHNTAAYKEVDPRIKKLTHKCNPDVAKKALEQMKKLTS